FIIGGGWLLYQYVGIPTWLQTMPFVPRTPTPTPVVVDDGSVTMALGEQLLQAGRLEDAVGAFEEAAKTAGSGAEELRQVAAEFARQDKPADSAIKSYQAGKATERASMAHSRIARILALRGWNADMTARAVDEARKALELDAKNADARAVLVLAYDRNNQYDAAIQAGKEATELDKTNAEAFAFLAEAYADKAPMDRRAREAALTALRLNDKSPYAHRNYGYVLETERDYPGAAGEYLNAIALAPALSPFYLDLGRVYYMKLNKYDDAITALRRATELDPGNPQSFTELGRCYYSKGDYAEALNALLRATSGDSNYANAYGYLGWVYYFGLHQYDKAIPQFLKALELGRFSAGRAAEYYTELGWSYYFMGKCPDARPAFQKALDLLASQPDANIMAQARNGLAACPVK
ncbi:MAG: tetratricopeptide repeat protein, partial [Chloroflexota bacterium]|nr:tetratricopeptide repeat protein [Chloroflexota bacterium]